MKAEESILLEKTKKNYPSRISIAKIITDEVGLGTNSALAALCGEAFRSDQITENEIRILYGDPVCQLVTGLKTISSLQVEKSSHHSENFIRLLLSLAKDIRVVLIRMAEVLHNMRMAGQLPKTFVKRLAGEAYYLYAPIAHRLGFYHIKTELEERAMQILFPAEYQQISGKLKETEQGRNKFIRTFIAPIENALKTNGFEFEIRGRAKSVHSIWKKMLKQGVGFEQVYDILATRVILKKIREDEKSDCWRVYSLVTNIYPPNPSRLRDWITTPKSSGYEALHTTVKGAEGKWVEIQIRTARMDEKAERGEAAHWAYKEGRRMEETEEFLVRMRHKLENPVPAVTESEQPSWIDLRDSHIFIFTPQGDLIRLSHGSSVLDFAFQVHSDIGVHCTGAKVNGRTVPIKHILKNGDTVEIRTSKNQMPKQDWLKFVASPRARQKIKKILRDEELKEAETGKELLHRKLKNWKVPLNESSIDHAVKMLRFSSHMELYQAIALGTFDPADVKDAILNPLKTDVKTDQPDASQPVHLMDGTGDDVIFLDKGLASVTYTLANCCKPVFGDPVFGFVTISRGISVHRKNCPNAKDLQRRYNYRVVRVKWRETTETNAFQTTVKIQGIDQVGMLNIISDVITNEMNINIRSAAIESDKGLFKGNIKVFVKDQKQLEKLLHRLAKINGVLKVTL